MKKHVYLAFALTGALFMTACSNNAAETTEDSEKTTETNEEKEAEPSLVGEWQHTAFELVGEEVPEEEREMLEKTTQEYVDNTQYTFNEDGTYAVKSWMLGTPIEYGGTYVIEEDKVIMTDKGEDTEMYYELNDPTLVLTQITEEDTIIFTFKRK
jgi:hypothetical protein